MIKVLLSFLVLLPAVSLASGDVECPPAKPCKPGILLPVWQPSENLSECKVFFRAIVYLIALAYLFFGVSIVSDRFMASIEVITSKKKAVRMKKITGEYYTVYIQVWNETVSNLTLMALGSSAPEILLSVIEIFGNDFEAGDLGPSTIVGSAAFNLFVIIAICIWAIPGSEKRRVQHNGVFWVTYVWSTFAYVWLYLILSVFSPGEVEVWEGVLTFIFFPLTVATAYFTDAHAGSFGRRYIFGPLSSFAMSRRRQRSPTKAGNQNGVKDEHRASLLENPDAAQFELQRRQFLEIFKQLRHEHPDAPANELEKHAVEKFASSQKKSRAFYRVQQTRKLIGSGDIQKKVKLAPDEEKALVQKQKGVTVEFSPAHYMFFENVGEATVVVKCERGDAPDDTTVSVHYRTVADTAQEHSDFNPVEGTLTFPPGVTEKEIKIGIVDNDVYEEDEQFLVRLSQVRAYRAEHFSSVPVRLGAACTATVIIVDDDHAGCFGFVTEKYKTDESVGVFELEVTRSRGARGAVSIPYETINGAAQAGTDFEYQKGELRFEDEQTKAIIKIPIVNDDEFEKDEDFYVELGQPIWHNPVTDSDGADGQPILGISKCKIIIQEDKGMGFNDALRLAEGALVVGSSSWRQQFQEAITLESSEEDGEITTGDKILHYLSLPWKLLFATIPPTDYLNGWLCFIVAIIMIGMLTAVIGDVAAHFGCTVGLKDSVTALTLVAMGTSLPDTFASKAAAQQDEWADSSIGNVTGSNAVNVFLGIGIAWAIAAIAHAYRGTKFLVETGSLAFSVTMFIIGSTICVMTLQFRRAKVGGELGGPKGMRLISVGIFAGVWVLYILLSSLEAYCIIPGF